MGVEEMKKMQCLGSFVANYAKREQEDKATENE